MSVWFWIATMALIVVSAAMVLIILVQRPQGGGLAGAFGGAGGAGTDTVFGASPSIRIITTAASTNSCFGSTGIPKPAG